MNKTLIIAGTIVLFFLILFGTFGCKYNGMMNRSQTTEMAWADVESQYQRRNDMYGNIVSTIKSEANFEKTTLQAVVDARASVGKVQVNAKDLTPESIASFQAAQQQLSSSFSRLLVTMENYPDLKTTTAYLYFLTDIAGTENRIQKARSDFNKAVKEYNTYILTFPGNMIAGMFGFKEKGYFKADAGSEKAPDLDKAFENK